MVAMASGTNPASFPIEIIEMEIFPTQYTDSGQPVWETAVALAATQTFALLNGGYCAPGVIPVLLRQTSTPALQPNSWNQYLVAVKNEDDTLGYNSSNWQVLTIQDGR